jgi:universal stress protein A
MTLPRTILVATDFSEHADSALAYAAELAARFDGTIHLVHCITIPLVSVPELGLAYSSTVMESLTADAQDKLDERAALYRDRVAMAPVRLEVGDARDIIDRAAALIDADLIVMGTHGRRGVRRFLLGSVAEAVLRSAPCPVLTIRPQAHESEDQSRPSERRS